MTLLRCCFINQLISPRSVWYGEGVAVVGLGRWRVGKAAGFGPIHLGHLEQKSRGGSRGHLASKTVVKGIDAGCYRHKGCP